MKIFLFCLPEGNVSVESFKSLLEHMSALGIDCVVNSSFAVWVNSTGLISVPEQMQYSTIISENAKDGIIVCYGGDGTFLESVKIAGGIPIPILGINSGRLGFLTNVPKSDIKQALTALAKGEYSIEKRSLLSIKGDFGCKVDFPYAFNEFSLLRQYIGLISVDVEIDGERTVSYWSDGALVATPTGSTAYALSVGGPIVVPECNCMILAPIAPHNLTMRPIVIPGDSKMRLTVYSRSDYAFAGIDNVNFKVRNGASFVIKKSKKCVFLVKLQNISFYDTLKNKMMWGLDSRLSEK